ncbi:MAG TPA: phage antirepressor KilAC domain-containing protein [Micromonosporaceae bacterium]
MTHPDTGGGGTNGPGRNIQTFQFGDLPLRAVTIAGEPWFVGRDACEALAIADARSSLNLLDEDERDSIPVIDSMGRSQQTIIISESGLYSLILRSRKPEAKAFKRWITHEVLPAIRRTGRYEVARLGDPLDEIEAANQRAMQAVAIARSERERAERVAAELAEAAPKARSWDTLASGDGDFSVADAAKILSRDPVIAVGERRMFTVLADQGWIYRQRGDGRWRVYQSAVERGWLSEMPSSHYHPRTGELVLDAPQVRVTVKGLHELHRRLGGLQPLRVHEQIALPAP